MRGAWLFSFVGLLVCAGLSLAETPPVAPAPESAPTSDAACDSYPSEACQPAQDGNATRFWLTAEYLLWKVPDQKVPALVGTIPVDAAELVQRLPDTEIRPLFGGSAGQVSYDPQSGLRLGAGAWLDERFGLEAGFFQLEQGRQHALLQSAARAPLGVTFHDPVAGQQVLIMDAVPGLRDGAVVVAASNRVWGAEANALLRLPLPAVPGEWHLLAGFRHLQFDEGLDVAGGSTAVPGGRLPCG